MMHYRRSIIDVLKDVLPPVDDDQGADFPLWRNVTTVGWKRTKQKD